MEEIGMKGKRVTVTVSLPSDLLRKFDRMAKNESKSRSQLFRDMLRAYESARLEEEFRELQQYGARKAGDEGVVTEADVEAIVFGDR
jgi:metal-responsive CopG/Arc/MetJ family transcriptional regulator